MGIVKYIVATLIICATYVLTRVLQHIIKKRSLRKQLQKQFPAEPYHWYYGHLSCGVNENGLQTRDEWVKKYPRYYLYFLGPLKTRLFLNHPETLKEITKTTEPKDYKNPGGLSSFIPWTGDGLIISHGDKWFRNRKMLTYGFHFDVLKPYVDIYNQCTDILLDIIHDLSDAGHHSIDIFAPVSRCALDILLQCAFTSNKNIQRNKDDTYLKTVRSMTRDIYDRRFNPLHHYDRIYFLTSKGRSFLKRCELTHRFTGDIIDKRRNELKDMNETLQSVRQKRYVDFLDILLLATDSDGNGLSAKEILDEAETFMVAGHDTITSAICWTLYNLGCHPEVQSRARQEVDALLDDRNCDGITWSDLNDLTYLTRCIKESLRLHPSIPFATRLLTKPLKLDDKTAPAGTEIQLAVWNLHHNPEVWKDPLKYDPDRFLPENMAKMDSHAFLPFSAGPRNCIGQNFAMHEVKTTVARILRRFEVSVDTTKEVRRQVTITLRTENGLFLFFKERNAI